MPAAKGNLHSRHLSAGGPELKGQQRSTFPQAFQTQLSLG